MYSLGKSPYYEIFILEWVVTIFYNGGMILVQAYRGLDCSDHECRFQSIYWLIAVFIPFVRYFLPPQKPLWVDIPETSFVFFDKGPPFGKRRIVIGPARGRIGPILSMAPPMLRLSLRAGPLPSSIVPHAPLTAAIHILLLPSIPFLHERANFRLPGSARYCPDYPALPGSAPTCRQCRVALQLGGWTGENCPCVSTSLML